MRECLQFLKESLLACLNTSDCVLREESPSAHGSFFEPGLFAGRNYRQMAKTVLIVEDNELNMKLFHDLLEAHGYHTVGTRNGIEALDLARQHRPDLILMDIQLPEVSGLEVTKWLKDDPELRHIPVVAVTAFAMKGDEERIRQGGCEAYLSKPISVAKFIDTVRHFLGSGEVVQ
jgi:two-component system cell cycle response regulator DivK